MFWLLLTLIFLRPFISSLAFTYANFIYSTFFLGFLLIWFLFEERHLKESKSVIYPVMLFMLALIISLVFSHNKLLSIKELYKYASGILLFFVGISLPNKYKERSILCIVAAGLLISLMAIWQYLFGFQHLLSYIAEHKITDYFILDYITRKRIFFPFITPNILGGYLAMIILLALNYRNKIWFIIPLSIALLLTKSLSAFLSLFSALVVYFYLQGKPQKRTFFFLSGLLAVIGLAFILRSYAPGQHTQPIFSTVTRLNYWKDTLEIIKASALTGVGPGNFNLIQSRYAHNSYLQIWAEMGLLGIISILWLIAASFRSALKNIKTYPHKNYILTLTTANLAFLIHNLLDFSFFLPEVALLWWVILGLGSSPNSDKK